MGDTAKGLLGLFLVGAVIYGANHDSSKDDEQSDSSSSYTSTSDYSDDSVSDDSTYDDSTYGDSSDYDTLSGSSTCDEWNAAPYGDQVSLSQAIIIRLSAYDTSHSYAESFAENITTGCEPVGSLTVATVAGSIAALADADFP